MFIIIIIIITLHVIFITICGTDYTCEWVIRVEGSVLRMEGVWHNQELPSRWQHMLQCFCCSFLCSCYQFFISLYKQRTYVGSLVTLGSATWPNWPTIMCFYVRVAGPLAQNLFSRLCTELADFAVGMKRRLLYPIRRLLSRYDDVLPPEEQGECSMFQTTAVRRSATFNVANRKNKSLSAAITYTTAPPRMFTSEQDPYIKFIFYNSVYNFNLYGNYYISFIIQLKSILCYTV